MNNNSKVRIRNKTISDARKDYNWQTDPELTRLDATIVPDISFSQYLSECRFELSCPYSDRKEFAIETLDEKHIGNCVYYDIDWHNGEAQIGIMIGDREYWDNGYGTDAVNVLISRIFSLTKLKRIYLKTLDWNIRAQKCFRKCGFKQYGRMARDGYKFLLMEMSREWWQEQQTEKET
ncbi:GNAT family N-acetyltransferase [Chloroflexota bacterium]